MRELVGVALRRDICGMRLYSYLFNVNAIAFFKKSGYKIIYKVYVVKQKV